MTVIILKNNNKNEFICPIPIFLPVATGNAEFFYSIDWDNYSMTRAPIRVDEAARYFFVNKMRQSDEY